MRQRQLLKACALAAAIFGVSPTLTAAPAPDDEARASAEAAGTRIATELGTLCTIADPGDQRAFDTCRRGLFGDSQFKRSLQDYVLWGRQRDPNLTLKDSKLTQFGPDVLAGMYVPLFMFNGKYNVEYIEREGLFQIRLQTAFRNRLSPGQFPYPFWHEAEKWAMYEKANELILWWDAKSSCVKAGQFTVFGATPPAQMSVPVTPPVFDGQWRWTDAQGKSQPAVTLFDGLMSPDNPYVGKLDTAYKKLALRLREGQCFQCHVPSNPDGMKRLVLLQTPMHAAAEIKRVLKTVREDRMPRDEFGIESPLDPKIKDALLNEGIAFEKVLDQAREWEARAMAGAPARTIKAAAAPSPQGLSMP